MAVLPAPRRASTRRRGATALLAGLAGLVNDVVDPAAQRVRMTCRRHGHTLLGDSNGGRLCRRCGRTWVAGA